MSNYIMKILLVFLLGINSVLYAQDNPRLLFTAGLFITKHPYAAFYESRIFGGETPLGFHIENAQKSMFNYNNAIFFSDDTIDKKDIVEALGAQELREQEVFIGHSFVGFMEEGYKDVQLERSLGAAPARVKVVQRKNGSKTIYAFHFLGPQSVSWPTTEEQLSQIPGIAIKTERGRALVAARAVGSAEQKLGAVDEILKTTPALFVDVGLNNGEEANLDPTLMNAAIKRNALLLPGTSEMGALLKNKESFSSLDLVYPISGHMHKEIAGPEKLNIWSLADDEKVWSLFGALGKPATLENGLKIMVDREKDPNKSFNIVRTFTPESAAQAARSVYVDVVLLLSQDTHAQLPTREVIDLRNSAQDAFEQVAPIIQLSSLSACEVSLHRAKNGILDRVEITRHAISDHSPRAQEMIQSPLEPNNAPVLPDLGHPWEQKDFNSVTAGIVMKKTDADVVIFENDVVSTPISGAITADIALARLVRPGALSVIKVSGAQLKKIAQFLSNKKNNRFVWFGMDSKARMVRERPLNDEEYFQLALSENALLEVFGISMVGGLVDAKAVRAPFIESVYGRLENLFFLNATKTVVISESTYSIEKAIKEVRAQQTFNSVVSSSLSLFSNAEVNEYIANPEGYRRHTLLFNIDYLDVGYSQNLANQTYVDYKDGPVGLPMSRSSADIFTHLLIYTKLSLIYDAPGLITTLSNGIRFLMVEGFDKKPTKDKVTFDLDFRLPWERSYFKNKSVVISPVFNNSYETKLAPIAFLSNNTDQEWKKLKMLPRNSKLESLLGFNFNITNLGFDFDLGGMMATDFTKSSVHDALDFGPGMNFNGKWKLIGPLELSSVMTASYLFPLPKNQANGKAALGIEGTVWLRVARFYDFSLSLMSDFLFATLQEKPKDLAVSSIFGVTISYGRLMRIFG